MAKRELETDEALIAYATRIREESGSVTLRAMRAAGVRGDTRRLLAAAAQVEARYAELERHAPVGADAESADAVMQRLPGPVGASVLRFLVLAAAAVDQARSEANAHGELLRQALQAEHEVAMAAAVVQHQEVVEGVTILQEQIDTSSRTLTVVRKERDQLEAQCAERDAQIARLLEDNRAERGALQAQAVDERRLRDAAHIQVQEVEAEHRRVAEALAAATTSLRDEEVRAGHLERDLRDALAERDAARADLETERAAAAILAGELDDARATSGAAAADLERAHASLVAATEQIVHLQRQLDLESERAAQLDALMALMADVRDRVSGRVSDKSVA